MADFRKQHGSVTETDALFQGFKPFRHLFDKHLCIRQDDTGKTSTVQQLLESALERIRKYSNGEWNHLSLFIRGSSSKARPQTELVKTTMEEEEKEKLQHQQENSCRLAESVEQESSSACVY
ncbi:hypothetical protein V1264_007534 [Littorina saxatilis]|uniref:Uncharacterized protein n=1 Tax=Littorina saxatilis TaxID=31220 RepID=A0AAN9AV52_9CAEN